MAALGQDLALTTPIDEPQSCRNDQAASLRSFASRSSVPKAVAERLENLTFPGYPPMATPNCSTYGHPNCPRRDGQIMGFVVGVCDGFLG
jgi:hypothetical protein